MSNENFLTEGGMEDMQLFHGECLEVMDELIAKNIKVDAVICDPPY